jgi:hypothetical protein
MLFREWSAGSASSPADDGIETFLVRDGEIVLQTGVNHALIADTGRA